MSNKKWHVYAKISGGKYIGTVEAETEADAIKAGWDHNNASVSLCHACSAECEDAEIDKITVELDE